MIFIFTQSEVTIVDSIINAYRLRWYKNLKLKFKYGHFKFPKAGQNHTSKSK